MADPKDPKKSLYARLASRFAHLALGAASEEEECEEDEKEKKARADEEDGDGKDEKKARKARRARAEDDEDEDDEDGEEARAEEEDEKDEEDDGEEKKARKAAAAARASERSRWASVMSSAEAKGRVPLACSLLTDTNMNAEKIRAALCAAATEARQGLAARMAAVSRPDIGQPPPAGADLSTPKGRAAVLTAAYDRAIGRSRG